MADQQIVTNIVARSDFSNLIADVQRVTTSLSQLQQQFAGANRALAGQIAATNAMFKETLQKTGQFSSHFVSLTSDVEKFGRQLDGGRLKLKDYFRVYQDHVRTHGGLVRDLAKQQVQLQNAVLQPLGRNAAGLMQYNVHIPRGLDLTKNKTAILKQELQIMNKVIQDGGVQLINWGKNTQWAGRQLTVGLTLPLVAFGKAAADAFRVADQELTRLTKVYGDIAGTSATELSQIRKDVAATAKDLSNAMGVNFTETIALAADIAATGKKGNELLSSVSETTRLAVLGEVDRQDAMKATLAIQSAFQQNTEQLAESINFLNAVENQTSTTLNDLVEAIPKAGPVIKGLGGNIQDLALYLTAMREGGINASEGANALKSALASLINPTDVAVKKFNTFGIDLLGIVNKNAGSTTDTLFALQAALDKLNPLQKQQAIEQLFGKFQYSRLNALFENLGRQGSQTLQVLDLMKASAGELESVAARELSAVTESASGRYKRAVEGLKADLAGVGDKFLDIGTKLINVLDKVLEFGQKLPGPVKQLLTFSGAFTAIIGPVIMLTGVLANFFGYIVKGLGHFKALFKGAEGFKLLTPELIAAQHAGDLMSDEFYSDAVAADTLRLAIKKLSEDLVLLQKNAIGATTASSGLGQVLATTAGTPIIAAGGGAVPRISDPSHPLIGGLGRASAHINPRDPNNPATIFGLTLQPEPLNRVIGRTPQILMTERLPGVEGLTEVGGRSTGIVAGEHARYAALMATLGLQSRQEIEQLKKTIKFGGQVSSEFIATFDDILPITTDLSRNAAAQSAAIVAELHAGKITVDQAKAQIIAVNAQLERMMGEAVIAYGAGRGRTIDLTKAPLIDQPVVDASGKPNVRGMFRQGIFRDVMSAVGRATGTKTYGGSYSIETTRPLPPGYTVSPSGLIVPIIQRNKGGGVFYNNGDQVPGPNVNADVVPAMLTPGEFVIRRNVAQQDPEGMRALNEGRAMVVPIQNQNKGGRILGGRVSRRQFNYGVPTALTNSPYIDYTPNDLEMLDKYLDHLMSENYDFDFKSGVILNDSLALAQSGITDPDMAIQTARNHYAQTEKLMAEGYSYRDARALILQENPRLIAKTARQGVVNDILRKAIGDKMRSLGFLLGPNDEFLNRGHLDPIRSGRSIQTVGYWGTARMDRYNQFTNKLRSRLGFEDVIPDSSEAAHARASALLRTLGFNSYDEYLERRPEISRIVATGRTLPGRATPLGLFRLLGIRRNQGGIIPGYFGGGGVTRKWGRVYGGDEMSNQDPLHGPLQIGRFAGSRDTRSGRRGPTIQYKKPGQTSSVQAFLTGSLEDRGRFVTQEYMLGNYDVLRIPGAIEAMKAWGKKATGTFYRGINLFRYSSGPGPLPPWLSAEIKYARESGDFSKIIGKEFIMRRSSWSSDPNIAKEFGDFSITADVKNRRVTPSSEMFPEIGFVPKSAQNKSKAKKLAAARTEQESIFGGKFRITKADKNGIYVETVAGPLAGNRRFGGAVNAGMPYVVGENGPELFVPKNSGGIIPGYNNGGKIPGVQYRFGGGTILALLAALGVGYGGQKLGEKVGGGAGTAISTASSILPFMMMPGMMPGRSGLTALTKLGLAQNAPGQKIGQSVFAEKNWLGKYNTQVSGLATSNGKLASTFGRLLAGVTRFNLVLGAGTAIVYAGIKAWQEYKKNQAASAAQFGLTADQAQKAGLKYTSYTNKLKDAVLAQKLINQENKLAFQSMTSAGTPFNLTITEYKKLRKEVKETMSTQIEMFNRLQNLDEVSRVAAQLKVQFIAAGMSVEDANKKIYTLLQLSNKSTMTISAMSSQPFKDITNAQKAAAAAIENFNFATQFENTKDQAFALNTALQAIDNSITDLYKKAEDAANKKKKDFDATKALRDAEKQTLKEINSNVENQVTLSTELYNQILKQDPILGKMVNKQDTMVSLWQKMKIAAMGYSGVLSGLNSDQTNQFYELTVAVSEAIEKQNKSQGGLLEKQYARLGDLNARYKALATAAKGQSVQKQIDARKSIELIDEEIKKINERADARKKELQDAQSVEDYSLQMQKLDFELQQAVATGDMQAAAQAQLGIREVVSNRQTALALDEVERQRQAQITPLQEKRDAITKGQQDLADNAALASESLDKLAKEIKDQESRINKVNTALLNYRLMVLKGEKDYGKLNTAAAGAIKALEKAGVAVDGFKKYVEIDGPFGTKIKQPLAPKEILDSIIEKTDGLMSIESILAQKDILIDSANGDIYINGKKIDDTKGTSGTSDNPYKPVGINPKDIATKSGGILEDSAKKTILLNLLNAGNALKAGEFFEYGGIKYKIKGMGTTTQDESGKYTNIQGFDVVAQKKFGGGSVSGPGTGTSDSIPAYLSDGEYVIRASSVDKYGKDFFDGLNAQKFDKGGLAGNISDVIKNLFNRNRTFYHGSPNQLNPGDILRSNRTKGASATKSYNIASDYAKNKLTLRDGKLTKGWGGVYQVQSESGNVNKGFNSFKEYNAKDFKVIGKVYPGVGVGGGGGLFGGLMPFMMAKGGLIKGYKEGGSPKNILSSIPSSIPSFVFSKMADFAMMLSDRGTYLPNPGDKTGKFKNGWGEKYSGYTYGKRLTDSIIVNVNTGSKDKKTIDYNLNQAKSALEELTKITGIEFKIGSGEGAYNLWFGKQKGMPQNMIDEWQNKPAIGFSSGSDIGLLNAKKINLLNLDPNAAKKTIMHEILHSISQYGRDDVKGDHSLNPFNLMFPGLIPYLPTRISKKDIRNIREKAGYYNITKGEDWQFPQDFGYPRKANGGYVNSSYFSSMSMPSYKTGVKELYSDTIAQLHKGEAVIPASMNPWNSNATNPIGETTMNIGNVTFNFENPPQDGKKLYNEFKQVMQQESARVGINRSR